MEREIGAADLKGEPPRLDKEQVNDRIVHTPSSPAQACSIQYLDLQPSVRYNFTLVVSDDGGAARAHLRMPDSITVSALAPADVDETTSGVTRNLTLFGERSSPTTGLVISGTLVAPPNISFEFHVEGDDFGGAAGRSNQRFVSINAFVGEA